VGLTRVSSHVRALSVSLASPESGQQAKAGGTKGKGGERDGGNDRNRPSNATAQHPST
jgi:hypothetical protein